jgi:hypothetical protein
VPDRADPVEVERGVELREQIDAGGDVEEGLGPTSAVPDASVFEVPRREPVGREVLAERRHQRAVVASSPVAAVDDDDDRRRSPAVGEMELAELARVVSVAMQ